MTSAHALLEPPQDLWRSGPRELAEILHRLMETSRLVDALIGRVLNEIDVQGAKNLYGYSNTPQFVAAAERMRPRDAKRLVDRATAINAGRRLDGSDDPPVAPLTGVVAREGVLGAGHIDTVVAVMSKIPADVTAEDRAEAEEILVNLARKASPIEVGKAGRNILARLDPDGPAPDDRDPVNPLRTLRFQKKRNGMLGITIEVDALLAAQTRAVLDPLAEKRTADEGEPDTRTQAERYGDAYAEIIGLVIMSPELPTQAGDHVHISVVIPFDILRTELGKACLDLTDEISATDARILACDCGVIPAVLNSKGELLDLGRMKRLVTPGQRRALRIRDRGCAFPGCCRMKRLVTPGQRRALRIRDRGCAFPGCCRKPQHCQAHHIVEWVLNGLTDLDNLVLVCAHHHRLLHRSAWVVRMGEDGLPEFIPPDYLDPLQAPRRNTMHPPLALAN